MKSAKAKTPAANTDQKPTEAPAAKAKKKPATDKLGSRAGSQAATINAALTTKPQTLDALIAATGSTRNRVQNHMLFLMGKGHVVKSDDGFALSTK